MADASQAVWVVSSLAGRAWARASEVGDPAAVDTPPGRDEIVILTILGSLASKALGPSPDGQGMVLGGFALAEQRRCTSPASLIEKAGR